MLYQPANTPIEGNAKREKILADIENKIEVVNLPILEFVKQNENEFEFLEEDFIRRLTEVSKSAEHYFERRGEFLFRAIVRKKVGTEGHILQYGLKHDNLNHIFILGTEYKLGPGDKMYMTDDLFGDYGLAYYCKPGFSHEDLGNGKLGLLRPAENSSIITIYNNQDSQIKLGRGKEISLEKNAKRLNQRIEKIIVINWV